MTFGIIRMLIIEDVTFNGKRLIQNGSSIAVETVNVDLRKIRMRIALRDASAEDTGVFLILMCIGASSLLCFLYVSQKKKCTT